MIRRWQLQMFMWQGTKNTKNSSHEVTRGVLEIKAGRCGRLDCQKGLGKGEQEWEERMRKLPSWLTEMTLLAPTYHLKIVNTTQLYPNYFLSDTCSIFQPLPLYWKRSWNAPFLPISTKCCHIIQNSITKHKTTKISPHKALLRLAPQHTAAHGKLSQVKGH